MVLKEITDKANKIKKLEELLKYDLTKEQKYKVQNEINGFWGEKNSAYFIDSCYKDSQNWIILHDLRFEVDGEVLQIDHLLINRFLEFYVLETKNFNAESININRYGEFSVTYRKRTFGIESPIEQNLRHIELLKKLIEKNNLISKRLFFSKPKFFSYILISPKSIIKRSKDFDSSMVIKADNFKSEMDRKIESIGNLEALSSLTRVSSFESIRKIGSKLLVLDKSSKVDYLKKFDIKFKKLKSYYCYKCKKTISEKVAKFCWDNKSRFNSKAYCLECQKDFVREQMEMV